jgi:arsenite methyltransferase
MSKAALPKADYGIDAPGLQRGFLMGGIALILGGEALCFFGPESYARPRNIVCHILFYSGVVFVFEAAIMYRASRVGKLRLRDKILRSIPWRGDERVLDVGCGHGLMLLGAAKRLTAGRAYGVDIWSQADQASNSVEATLENARREGVSERIEIKNADARELPFADNSFDVVLSSLAIHNIYDPAGREKAIREIARVLKPRGRFVIADIRHAMDYAGVLRGLGWSQVEIWFTSYMFISPMRVLRATKP